MSGSARVVIAGALVMTACRAPSIAVPPTQVPAPISLAFNDCPGELLGPFTHELFPACPALPYFAYVPQCGGSSCDRPCAANRSGRRGEEQREVFDDAWTFEYDASGRLIAGDIGGEPHLECTYAGDALERCTWGGTSSIAAVRDGAGRITAIVEASERLAVEYDERGRVIAVGPRDLAYDDRGSLLTWRQQSVVHDDRGRVVRIGPDTKQAQRFAYDGDRLVAIHGPGIASETFAYDAAGRLVRHRVANHETRAETTYRYDCK